DRVGELGAVLVAALAGHGGVAQRGRGGAGDVGPGAAAVGAALPLHGRGGAVVDGDDEGGGLAGDDGGVGGVGDRLDGQRRGGAVHRAGGGSEGGAVLVAVLRDGRGEAVGAGGGAGQVIPGGAGVGRDLPLHRRQRAAA